MADHDGSPEVPAPPALPVGKTCLQCRFSSWLVGVGQGFRCRHPLKKPTDSFAWLIPSRSHVCELFEERVVCRSPVRTFPREAPPEWLAAFDERARFPREAFFRSRIVFASGSGTNGYPVEAFGWIHAAHTFVYADPPEAMASIVARLDDPSPKFAGYLPGPRLPVSGRDLFAGWREPHLEPGEIGVAGRPEATDEACGFLQVLQRRCDPALETRPERLAVLYLFRDAAATYDALFCQHRDRPAPFAVRLRDRGLAAAPAAGGTVSGDVGRAGRSSRRRPLERVAERAGVFPDYLLPARKTRSWEEYCRWGDVAVDADGATPIRGLLWRQ